MYQFKRSPSESRHRRKKNKRSLSPGRKISNTRSYSRSRSPQKVVMSDKHVHVPGGKIYISKKNLNIIYTKKLELDHEVCGFIERGDTNSLKVNEQENILLLIKADRKSCQTTGYSEIYYHTHPNNSKFYPSHEDIIKVMKKNEIMSSIIFTKYGIWEIVRKNRDMYFNNLSMDEQKYLEKKIRKTLDKIYFKNKEGRHLRNLSFIHRIMRYLEELLKDDYSIDISIHFTLWSNTNYVLKYQGF